MNRFIGFAYSLIVRLAGIVLLPAVLYKAFLKDRSYLEHLGIYPENKQHVNEKSIWFHCASVGEAKIATMVIDAIKRTYPDSRIVFTVVTPAGKKMATEILGDSVEIYYFPLDFNFILKRAFKFINPEKVILTETEIYPNLLKRAITLGHELYLINGRISDRSYHKYHAVKDWLGPILSRFSYIIMQADNDLDRIVSLGADPDLCRVMPNIKYDLMHQQLNQIDKQKTGEMLALNSNECIIVAGSTRAGEERIIACQFSKLKEKFPDLVLVIAPRHLDRLNEVESYLKELELSYSLRSNITTNQSVIKKDVILLDTMGELTSVYAIAKAAFVGGSLVNKGGQNPLEPIGLGIPTCYGPHMENFEQIEKTVSNLKLSVQVQNESELYNFFDNVISGKISSPDPSRLFELYGRSAGTTAEIIMKA
jgi:3-deoxy-D-manno-octulosonic-acid transferase